MTRSLRSDLRAIGARVKDVFRAAPGWVGGVLTGLQAVGISLLVVIVPATAALATVPVDGPGADVGWSDASGVAARLWLLAHGVPIPTTEATFTLIPLGLTAVTLAVIAAVARRFAAKTWGSAGLAVVTYAAATGLVAALTYGLTADARPLVVRAAVAGAIVAAPAVAVGIWRQHGAEFGWVTRVPHSVRSGLRLGIGVVAGCLMLAGLGSLAWAVVGRHEIADAATGLGVDGVGGVALAVTETMYVPDMVIWNLAWMSGQGFVVGDGNLFSPSVVGTATLPALPLLGALPQAAGGWLVWAPVIVVAVAALAWIALRRGLRRWAGAMAGAVAAVTVALLTAALVWAAAGSAGPGSLATVGAEPLPVALTIGGLAAAGFVLAAGTDLAWRAVTQRSPSPQSAPSPHQSPEAAPAS